MRAATEAESRKILHSNIFKNGHSATKVVQSKMKSYPGRNKCSVSLRHTTSVGSWTTRMCWVPSSSRPDIESRPDREARTSLSRCFEKKPHSAFPWNNSLRLGIWVWSLSRTKTPETNEFRRWPRSSRSWWNASVWKREQFQMRKKRNITPSPNRFNDEIEFWIFKITSDSI